MEQKDYVVKDTVIETASKPKKQSEEVLMEYAKKLKEKEEK